MTHSLNNLHSFLPDDFFEIDNKYFKQLRSTGKLVADPSYWFDSESPIHDLGLQKNIEKYNIDFNNGLQAEKSQLIEKIDFLDNQPHKFNNVTLCSSATSASYIVLRFLRDRINVIFFETPAYYASIEQAKGLGFHTELIPSYYSNNFQVDWDFLQCNSFPNDSKAIWLTQPRFGTGVNQNQEALIILLNAINENDFLVIDEATEQYFPTFLNKINYGICKNVIKIRSFLKPIGLNGPRLSYILHDVTYRPHFQTQLEITQGAIDCFSLQFTCNILHNTDYYLRYLERSRNHVKNQRETIELLTKGTNLQVIPIENGYIGSLAMKIYNGEFQEQKRNRLLSYCKKMKVAIILGSAMYFALDNEYEFIRINFFNTEYNITNGVEILLDFC